jgi:hypothetical protein
MFVSDQECLNSELGWKKKDRKNRPGVSDEKEDQERLVPEHGVEENQESLEPEER